MAWTTIELPGAEVALDSDWLPRDEADTLMEVLRAQLPWTVHRIRIFGRLVDSPRLSCWIGDPGASYAYSGTRFEPLPWPDVLRPVRDRVSVACGVGFNSVLANLYRDGRDSMGWHRDDEPELGPEPMIASLSLGATRRFLLRQVATPQEPARPRASTSLELPAGSLLRMRGATQRLYRHALPRTRRRVGARINLTFRSVRAMPA